MRTLYVTTIYLAVAMATAAALLLLPGCNRSRVEGGQESHNRGGLFLESRADGTTILRDNRDVGATTQPSVETSGTATLPRTDSAAQGVIGGVNFEQLQVATQRVRAVWWLAPAMLAAAFVLWKLGSKFMAAGAAASGFLVAINPTWAAIASLAVLGYLAFRSSDFVGQLKAAFRLIDQNQPAGPAGSDAAGFAREKLDPAAQRAVGIEK